MSIPRRKAKLALAHALSVRAAEGALRVLDGLAIDGGKTRQVADMLKALGARTKSLLVIEAQDKGLATASRNIPELKIMVLNCDKLIVTKGALEKLSTHWN